MKICDFLRRKWKRLKSVVQSAVSAPAQEREESKAAEENTDASSSSLILEVSDYHDLRTGFANIPDDNMFQFRHESAARFTAGWVKKELRGRLQGIQDSGFDILDQIQLTTENIDGFWGIFHAQAMERFTKELVAPIALVAYGSYGRREYYYGSDFDAYLIVQDETSQEEIIFFFHHVTEDAFGKGVSLAPSIEAINWGTDDKVNSQIVTSFLDCRFVRDDMTNTAWKNWESWRFGTLNYLQEYWRDIVRVQSQEVSRRYFYKENRNSPIADDEDLKEGRGGLRDFHFLRWVGLAKALANTTSLVLWAQYPSLPLDLARSALIKSGLLNDQEWREALYAYLLLLRVRASVGRSGQKPPQLMPAHYIQAATDAGYGLERYGGNQHVEQFLNEMRSSREKLRRLATAVNERIANSLGL